jgi:hypothetical protein
MNRRSEILSEADTLINGDRQESYGTPQDNFGRIAAIWSVILGVQIRPDEVALCMAGLKMARLVNGPHDDSYIDAAAYIALAGELADADKG